MIYAYIAAAIAAAALATGGWLGYKHMQGEVFAAKAETALAVETSRLYQKSLKQEAAKEVIVTRYVNKIVEVEGAVREVIRDAPPIVCEQTAAGAAVLSSAFRVQHDRLAATATRAYAGTSVADGTPSTAEAVTPQEVLDGVGANYALCAITALKLVGLQEFERQRVLAEITKSTKK